MIYVPNVELYLVSGVESYQSLARLLSDPPPTNASENGKLSLYVLGPFATEQLPGLDSAFRSNQWVKTLSLAVDMAAYMAPMLGLVLLLSKLEKLTLEMGLRDDVANAALLQGVASFVRSAQSSLQHLKINYGRFNGDCMPFWNALQHNDTLQEVTFSSGRFDAANATAFADCFNSTEKVLSMCGGGGGTFDGTTVGVVCARMWAHPTQLKALKLDGIGSEPDLATKFEPFCECIDATSRPWCDTSKTGVDDER